MGHAELARGGMDPIQAHKVGWGQQRSNPGTWGYVKAVQGLTTMRPGEAVVGPVLVHSLIQPADWPHDTGGAKRLNTTGL